MAEHKSLGLSLPHGISATLIGGIGILYTCGYCEWGRLGHVTMMALRRHSEYHDLVVQHPECPWCDCLPRVARGTSGT